MTEIKGPGYFNFYPRAVNDSGQVAGGMLIDTGNPNTSPGRGFRWEGGTSFLVLEPDSTCCGFPLTSGGEAINNAGQVAGNTSSFREGIDETRPTEDCYENKAARWGSGGGRTTIFGFGAPKENYLCPKNFSSAGYAIDEGGLVVGSSPADCGTGTAVRTRAFRMTGNGIAAVGAACEQSLAVDVNSLGEVLLKVGSSFRQARVVRTSDAVDVNLEVGSNSLNGRGTVVGRNPSGQVQRFNAGTYTTLAPLPGSTFALPRAIAEDDSVVGYSSGPTGPTATLWKPDGTAVDLNDVVGASAPARLETAEDISDNANYIVGTLHSDNPQQSGARGYRLKLADSPEMKVELKALSPDGSSAEGQLRPQEDYLAQVTVTNTGDVPLNSFSFTGGKPLAVDGRGTGGLGITGEIGFPADMTLAPKESKSAYLGVTTLREGLAAVHSKIAALTESGTPVEGSGSLLFRIANRQEVTDAIGRFLVLQLVDRLMFKNSRDFYESMLDRGAQIRKGLVKALDAKQRRRWFGNEAGKLQISNLDRAMGLLKGVPPEVVAARLPDEPVGGFSEERLAREYDEAFKKKAGEGIAKWVKGYSDLKDKVQKAAQETWAAALLNHHYYFNTATEQERQQVEAFYFAFSEGVEADSGSVYNTLKAEIPRWRENGLYATEALQEAEKNGGIAGFLKSVGVFKKLYDQEQDIRSKVYDYADSDPLRFQREIAARDAHYLNQGVPVVLDTLLGGGAAKIVAKGKQLVVGGKGASVIAAGELIEEGNVASMADEVASGMPLETAVRLDADGGLLANTKGATLVQSSDYGNIYSLPNLGGLPETTLDAKAKILGEIEKEYAVAFGKPAPKLVEVLKTSSPLRKPNGVAKLELTAGKTGKPSMIDAGMPADGLGEAVYWKSDTNPRKLPGFDDLPPARQDAALEEFNLANERYKKYLNPPAGSKEAKLKALIGKRGRVPLDDEPKAGLQRFIVGEFEEVTVKEGGATAKLIRVKHYEIETVQYPAAGVSGPAQVVNRKTVVDNLEKAVAQTADADAVAVGKVTGTDPKTGAPTVVPLDRAEREFVMGRYVDKNIKARRAGTIPDLSEHGVTLVMEDASAKAAGYLLPSFGAVFLPEQVARAHLARIAPFVKPAGTTNEAMLEKMLELVRSEGGFGQHAVVVTSDSRYLGEVPFERW